MNDRPRDEQAQGPPAGLCSGCVHVRRITNARGSTFYMCRLSFEDPRFPRYPPIPVVSCAGFEPGDSEGQDQLR